MLTLLVPGQSDSAGEELPDAEDAWPKRLCAGLRERTGVEVELVHRHLYIHLPSAAAFAMKCVAEASPEIVVVPLGTHSFAVPRVALRARDRFGPRAERLCNGFEARFRWLANRGRAGRAVDRAGRRVGRLLIGARTYGTYEGAVANFSEIIHRLSAEESLEIVVVGATFHAKSLQGKDSALAALIPRFNEEMRGVVAQHRLTWVDGEAAVSSGATRELAYSADGLHKSAYGHQLFADAIMEPLLRLPALAAAVAGT